ncbi:MAG: protein-disulfide reductase DsbD [Rhodocyclaceae bacterium]
MRFRLPHGLVALLLSFFAILAYGAADPLPPEQAFRFSARAISETAVEVRFEVQPGYYLYRDRTRIAAVGATAGQPEFPAGGEIHEDEFFGKQTIYRGPTTFRIPVDAPLGRDFTLTVTAQGCADTGVCYPPTPFKANLRLAAMSVAANERQHADPLGALMNRAAPQMDVPGANMPTTASSNVDNDDAGRIARLLSSDNLALSMASFFGFGLLLCFTPCVLPMIPIVSGTIVGHGNAISRGRAALLSIAYVLGMAVTYTLAGVAAALSGTLLAIWLQNAWVLGAFALVFVVLALSMFGLYELQLPAGLQSRLSGAANRQRGSVGGIALMGALSAVIVGPCMAAPLAGALLYIAQSGNAVLGGAALFSLALGMGAPLVVVGVAARHWLPKPGPWMEGIKRLFGVLLLATAIWLVSPVVPAAVPMFAWAVLLVLSGVFLRALDSLPPRATGAQRLLKGLGILVLVTGVTVFVGALAGSRDPLRPLAAFRARQTTADTVHFERISSVANLDARIQAAGGKPVMLDFYADWCVSCKEMERYTFPDAEVSARMGQFVLLQADVTANTAQDRELLRRFGLFGPPGIVFFDGAGREVTDTRVVGFMGSERFTSILDTILNRSAP